jgi:ketosteroid isomerase-like protein
MVLMAPVQGEKVGAMIGAVLTRARLSRLFASMRRKDWQAVCRDISDDGVFEFPGRSTMSGRHEGRPAIEAFWRRDFDRMQSFNIRPKRIALAHPYAFGATNTALVEWVADEVTRDGITAHLEGVAVIEIRRGKMIFARDYVFDPSLLEPIWGHRPEAPAATGVA